MTVADKTAPPKVDHVEKYKTVVSSGQSTLRALLTMNGGAIVVFLTSLDHLLDKGQKMGMAAPELSTFVVALSWYIAGIFAALLSYSSIFITNCFSSVKYERSSNAAFVVTLVCGFVSLVSFLVGSWMAIIAFRALLKVLVR